MRKRLLIAIGVVALVVFPATALAKIFTYTGDGLDEHHGTKVVFDVKGKINQQTGLVEEAWIVEFVAKKVHSDCPQGPVEEDEVQFPIGPPHSNNPFPDLKVQQDGEFDWKYEEKTGGTVFQRWVLRGQFKTHAKDTARGMFRIQRSEGGIQDGCNTGRVDWKAEKD
jgi:hypothetical protein